MTQGLDSINVSVSTPQLREFPDWEIEDSLKTATLDTEVEIQNVESTSGTCYIEYTAGDERCSAEPSLDIPASVFVREFGEGAEEI